MAAHRMLPDDSYRFRRALIDGLYTDDAIGYITEDAFVGRCPVCGDHVNVRFHGYAPRADLKCHGGCTEPEITAMLRNQARAA